MPTAILLDTSLSMLRLSSSSSSSTYLELGRVCVDGILSHLQKAHKLESVSLMLFDSNVVSVSNGLTKELGEMRDNLASLLDTENACRHDKTDLIAALNSVSELFTSNLMSDDTFGCDVVLVADERVFNDLNHTHSVSAFSFPLNTRLHYLCVANAMDKEFEVRCRDSVAEVAVNLELCTLLKNELGIEKMVEKVVEKAFDEFVANLALGDKMNTDVALCPPPPDWQRVAVEDEDNDDDDNNDAEDEHNDDQVDCKNFNLDIQGFLSLSEVASPPVVSRHVVLPLDKKEESNAQQTTPNLVVFLHGALKVESLCALIKVRRGWFGLLFSWSDTKKKSCLLLALFRPGLNSVAWLGSFHHMGSMSALNNVNTNLPMHGRRPSYAASVVCWIRAQALQSDVQKILRHARKLPEKTNHFYKELNKVKRAALSIGFDELLESLSSILEKEAITMTSSSNPDCSLQLKHAASELRSETAKNVDQDILPHAARYNL